MLATSTSLRATSRAAIWRPSAALRSTAIERLLRLKARNFDDIAPERDGPPSRRNRSPSSGSSLTTSAPWSARVWVHTGPTTTAVRSSTLTPASGPPVIGQSPGQSSGELGVRLQRQRAVGVEHPELRAAVACRGAAQADRPIDEQRPDVARRHRGERPPERGTRRLEQQQGGEPAVDDALGIALDGARVVGVVVDA